MTDEGFDIKLTERQQNILLILKEGDKTGAEIIKSYKQNYNKVILLGSVYSDCKHMMQNGLVKKHTPSTENREKYTLDENGKKITDQIQLNMQTNNGLIQLVF